MDRFWEQVSAKSLNENVAIQVYQTNFIAARLKALECNYPTVKSFLGERLFQSVARHYAESIPSVDSSLNRYGLHFPEFLKEIGPHNPRLSHLLFIDEVAQVDWLMAKAYFAPDDAECVDLSELNSTNITPSTSLLVSESVEQVMLCRHELLSLPVCSALDGLPFMMGEDFMRDLQLKRGSEVPVQPIDSIALAVYRPEMEVLVRKLSNNESQLVAAIGDGIPLLKLETAVDEPDGIPEAVANLKGAGILIGFSECING